jgi:hypothetical protein
LAVFDGDGFILQVHGVFMCIRSGATTLAIYGGALGSALHSVAAVVGDSPRGPLKQRGNPHLNPGTETR